MYECEKCGHRNFVTDADLDAMRVERRNKLLSRLSPDQPLGEPVREYKDTFSIVGVIKRAFGL